MGAVLSGRFSASNGAHSGVILFVDDEPNILSSLRRLFRSEGYQTLIAESGEAGLKILETETVDLIVSDMRMPEMDGAHFLEIARARWPDTMRLLLTGYADVSSIMQAVNRGEIYRYITKPWDENEILLIVRQALERKALEHERQRLEELTCVQNDELTLLNASLEKKVEARTIEIKRMHDGLIVSNEKLRVNFLTSIKMFSNLIEIRGKGLAGHSLRVADLANTIAKKMELEASEIQQVFVAGLLHNIGKIGFSDELLAMPVSLMNGQNLALYRKYPARGEQLLMPLEDLQGAAKIVRSHQERFDGAGFPDQLTGFNIPLGSRIVALASDFHNLQIGTLSQRCLRSEEAVAAILENQGKRYDPAVVNAFRNVKKYDVTVDEIQAISIYAKNLQPGMIMARDLITNDGFLLLSAGHVLNERLIRQILEFEASTVVITIYVRSEGAAT